MAQHRHLPQSRPSPAPKRVPYATDLAAARLLIEGGQADIALEALIRLDGQYPNRADILDELTEAAFEAGDLLSFALFGEQLLTLNPNNADLMLALGSAYFQTGFAGLAYTTTERFVRAFPRHPEAVKLRSMLAEIRPSLEQALPPDVPLSLAIDSDRIGFCLAVDDLDRGRSEALRALKQHPNYIPILHNLSLIEFMLGNAQEAIGAAQRVLERDADNYHAHANLVRFLLLTGRGDEARVHAEQLRQATSPDPVDLWVKQMEAFSYLGDDAAVLEVAKNAGLDKRGPKKEIDPALYHYAAVATLSRGDSKKARRYWERALDLEPDDDVALDNLDDLDLPPGERNGPWAFTILDYMPHRIVGDIGAIIEDVGERQPDASTLRKMRDLLHKHPALMAILPQLMLHGDPNGCFFAVALAHITEMPELLPALRDFALGPHGPDAVRVEAAEYLIRKGQLPAGPLQLWQEGQQREVLLMGFEIYDEAVQNRLPPKLAKLIQNGADEMLAGDFVAAERAFVQVLDKAPDSFVARYNQAMALEGQGRFDEAAAIYQEVHGQHPDYFFGRIGMTKALLRQGKLDEAAAMLQPLLQSKRLHVSEFNALCNTQIDLALALGDRTAAQSWDDLWRRVTPDAPPLAERTRGKHKKG